MTPFPSQVDFGYCFLSHQQDASEDSDGNKNGILRMCAQSLMYASISRNVNTYDAREGSAIGVKPKHSVSQQNNTA